jgi:twitching motility protein PilT
MDVDARIRMELLLRRVLEMGASDLHLAAESVPQVRVCGTLTDVADFGPVSDRELRAMLYSLLPPPLQRTFEERWELDFSIDLGVSRFRGNLLRQRGRLGAVMRAIPSRPLTIEELGLPAVCAELVRKPRGLLIVCGPSGSGKSTTLAALIDEINRTRRQTIVTIEDPVEFVHENKQCLIRQRELGADTRSFAEALKHVLRQDPDVIMVGEMRDLETVSLTLTAAETGHLALATLHTHGAAAAIDRMVDVFPPHHQSQVRLQLSMSLVGVISQTLLPRADGEGRVLAPEILVGTPGVRSLIREGKSHQMNGMMHSGGSVGMVTLEASLKRLLDQGVITLDEAMQQANDAQELKRLLEYGTQVVLRR